MPEVGGGGGCNILPRWSSIPPRREKKFLNSTCHGNWQKPWPDWPLLNGSNADFAFFTFKYLIIIIIIIIYNIYRALIPNGPKALHIIKITTKS